jgi:hypothetical protein
VEGGRRRLVDGCAEYTRPLKLKSTRGVPRLRSRQPHADALLEELAEAHWSFMDGYADVMIARGLRVS